MFKQQLVSYSYTCDVCGDAISVSDGDSATRKVSWEGAVYVVDVCTTHGSQLGDLLTELKAFADAGNRVTGRRGRRAGSATAVGSRAPGRRAAGSTSASGTAPQRGDLGAARGLGREDRNKL